MPLVPDISRQPIGNRFSIGLIFRVLRNDHDAAARHVAIVADVADMPGNTADPWILFQVIHITVNGKHRFIRGHALFPAQNQRQLAVDRMNVLPILQQIAKHLGNNPLGLLGVGMRRLAVAAQNRTVIHIFLTQVAMRIADDRNRQIRTGDFPDRL